MKPKLIIFLLLAFLSHVHGQSEIRISDCSSAVVLVSKNYPGSTSIDTIPSWIVYVDSVRMFATSPEFDLRLEVVPGWTVQKRIFGHVDATLEESYYDTEGRKFNPDIVLFTNRRKVVYNKFRQ